MPCRVQPPLEARPLFSAPSVADRAHHFLLSIRLGGLMFHPRLSVNPLHYGGCARALIVPTSVIAAPQLGQRRSPVRVPMSEVRSLPDCFKCRESRLAFNNSLARSSRWRLPALRVAMGAPVLTQQGQRAHGQWHITILTAFGVTYVQHPSPAVDVPHRNLCSFLQSQPAQLDRRKTDPITRQSYPAPVSSSLLRH